MKRKARIFFILFFIGNWAANLSAEDEIILDLFPQTRPNIYSVGFKHKGVDLWYQLEWSEFRDGKPVKVTCDIFLTMFQKTFTVQEREG